MLFDGPTQTEVIREIAENLSDPVFLVDRSFNVWYFNRAFQDAVGVRMASRRYKDKPCHELLGLTICQNDCVMKQVIHSNKPASLAEITGETAAGLFRNFHINAIPLVNPQGNAFGALIVLRDNTAEVSLQKKYKDMVARTTKISLSGRIEDGNLPDILQLFSFLQKSGRLRIAAETNQGELVFDRGKVIFASDGKTTQEKAFNRIVSWTKANFEFDTTADTTVPQRLETSSDFLLMDALREQDELNRLAGSLPSRELKLRILRDADPDTDMLDETATRILALISSSPSVGELLDSAPDSDGLCYMALLKLHAREIITW